MANLKSGVLVKLLEDMKIGNENATLEDQNKPALLQIRSIIPVLEEGNLLPNRGFCLKISDASHAIYVTLPQDQNELILGNNLKLGQFIYVHKLEDAQPFPLLKDLTPLPGRRPCDGTPEDTGSVPNFEKILDSSNYDFIVEKGVISEEKIMEISSNLRRLSLESSDDIEEVRKKSDVLENSTAKGKFRSLSASKTRPGNKRFDVERRNSDVLGLVSRSRRMSVDNDSDTDSTVSSVSSSIWNSKRKSWNELKKLGADEIFDSSVVKHNIRPPRCRSATVSPVRSVKYDSSDDNSSSISRRRLVGSAKKIVKSSTKNKNSLSKVNSEQAFHPIKRLVYDRQGAESGISWDSLPSSLVNLGKEVIKQRDIALFAAADALQEACAAERLLNSLSKFSEFHLPEEDDLQRHVDMFLDLQDDMAQTRLITKSLTNISPLGLKETDSSSTISDNEALTIAVQRKKNAAAWIKSVVALDLSPCSTSLNQIPNTMTVVNTLKKSSTSNHSAKQKGANIMKTDNRNTDDISFVLASNSDTHSEWTSGSTIPAATRLASALQDECRKMFLCYIEKYINELERKMSLMVSDNQVAAMMYKVKRVNDWLDVIINKEGNPQKDASKEGSNLDETEIEACNRVRNKIYGILLKNVERTAMAFESSNATLHR
ncbi:uncharacterized protein [Nicotiana tomentosiformis]|uniref:uncharacterized protein n=1 Tax=Nicotiana tomentosiformis TaxID=4098 RepID=UPI00051B258E|nr:uncharacterized protein LOC104094237 [Nicotiana tomentosiformis]